MDIILKLNRFLYALPLLTFRNQHFIYANFVIVTVPARLPWHLLRTYLVGIAIVAAAFIKMMHPVFILPV